MRQSMPVSEVLMWGFLRKRRLGPKFRRQVAIGPWIADFASFDPRIVIEVDGSSHDDRDESARTAFIESEGFTIIRVTNDAISEDPFAVAETLQARIEMVRRQALRQPES